VIFITRKLVFGFDPSPEWTLWFYLTHASRARNFYLSRRTGEHVRLHQAREFGIRRLRPSQIPNKRLNRSLIGSRCFSACWWCLRLTKAIMHSWFGRLTSHIGTETRSEPLRGAAVKNLGQWTQVRINPWRMRPVFCKVVSQDEENDSNLGWSADQLRASSRGKTKGAGVIRFDWV
jgi:hypothetical protein